jgi:hypothetical protein
MDPNAYMSDSDDGKWFLSALFNVTRLDSLEDYQQSLDIVWNFGNTYQPLSKINSITVYGSDFQTLKQGAWLNDTIISAYLELIMDRNKRASRQVSHYSYLFIIFDLGLCLQHVFLP